MNIRSALSLLGLAVALACGGGGSSSSTATAPPTPPPNTVFVGGAASDYGGSETTKFYPGNLVVTAGTTVTWKWSPGITMMHNVTSGTPASPNPGDYQSPTQTTGADFTHAFPTAGTYNYFCAVHGSAMTGTVTVN